MQVILGTAHGKNVNGKKSPDGRILEYEYSREICNTVKHELEKYGIKCVIDISDEYEKSLKDRVNIVNELCKNEKSIYVSIHLNASGDGSCWNKANGWMICIGTKASSNSKYLAECIFDAAKEKNIFGNRCIPETKWHQQNLYVCNYTNCPAVLTENMFQDNKEDVEFLLCDEGKQTIVDLHVKGILKYINTI